ncbi:MAG: MBL fold metallo-hydrolase [Bacilli bacterium]
MGTMKLPTSDYFRMEQLDEGVYAAFATEDQGVWSNSGIIDLGDATLVFDTFLTSTAAVDLRRTAKELMQRPIQYVINSHYHFDHVSGNQVFSDAIIISTTRTRELIQSDLGAADLQSLSALLSESIQELDHDRSGHKDDRIRRAIDNEINERRKFIEALPTLQVTLPTVTFEHQLQIHGSRRTVEVVTYGGGHTPSDAFLYLPNEKIAFMGDLVLVDTHPMIGDQGNPGEWLTILDKVSMLNIDAIVPGHGNIGNRRNISDMRQYLTRVKTRVENARRDGVSLESLLAEDVPNQYADWRFSHVYAWNLTTLYNKSYRPA